MKRPVLGVVCFWLLFPSHFAAQRGGGGFGGRGSGRGGTGFHGSAPLGSGFQGNGGLRGGFIGLPPLRPMPPLGPARKFNQIQKHRDAGAGSGFFPFASGYLDAGYYDNGNQGPVIVLQQPESPTVVPPPPPPPPPQPELHAYSWPESSNDPSALFTIISKDGAVSFAVAVWVQYNTVCYFAPDGSAGSLQLSSINREATRTANAAKSLTLSLPAETSRRR